MCFQASLLSIQHTRASKTELFPFCLNVLLVRSWICQYRYGGEQLIGANIAVNSKFVLGRCGVYVQKSGEGCRLFPPDGTVPVKFVAIILKRGMECCAGPQIRQWAGS